jgi:hypothetical protein
MFRYPQAPGRNFEYLPRNRRHSPYASHQLPARTFLRMVSPEQQATLSPRSFRVGGRPGPTRKRATASVLSLSRDTIVATGTSVQ